MDKVAEKIADAVEVALGAEATPLYAPPADAQSRIAELEAQLTERTEQVERMREALKEAADDIASWASYADDYFYQKHDAAGCIAKYRAIAAQQEQKK
jgi:hypothetical protein